MNAALTYLLLHFLFDSDSDESSSESDEFFPDSDEFFPDSDEFSPDSDESSSDEEDDFENATVAKRRRIHSYVNHVVARFDDTEFKQKFRMTLEAYRYTLEKVFEILNAKNTANRQLVERNLLATLWLLATQDSYRSVGERFNMPEETVSRAFLQIINAINRLARTIIKWPTETERSVSKSVFREKYGVEDIVGAIGGTYISMNAPADQFKAYNNGKRFTSITLQVICNENLKFLDCSVGFPSSVRMARIFRNSEIFTDAQAKKETYFSGNEKILRDKAHPKVSWLATPFLDRGLLTDEEKKENANQAKGRAILDDCCALLFGRFIRLNHVDMCPLECIPRVVLATCVLHNISIDFNDRIQHFIEEGRAAAKRCSAVKRCRPLKRKIA